MQITDIKLRKIVNDGPMKAVASVTFDDCFVVHDIKVIVAQEKTFIVMPSRKVSGDKYKDVAHPINAEFRAVLEGAVLNAYEEAPDAEPYEAPEL